MLIPRNISIMLALTSNTLCIYADGSNISPDVLTARLLEWLRKNGAYINEKLEVRHVVLGDASTPRGVFANEDVDVNETVCRIPWNLVLKSGEECLSKKRAKADISDCGTIKAVAKAMGGREITPYGRYLAAQPKGYTAGFWSEEARGLLVDMLDTGRTNHLTEYDDLPPHDIEDFLTTEIDCDIDIEDPLYRHSAMLVKARADYDILVPFYDMMNHHNGRYNVKHVYDPHKPDPVDKTGYEIVAAKNIMAGEELYNSYNHCNICSEYYDWFGTPEIFLHYGFVEPMPQRWLFDFARVKFDLDWEDGDESTGVKVVKFLVPPSEKGIALLQDELTRLKSFATTHRSMYYQDAGILTSEWEALWQYYDALYDALSHAVQSDAKLVDDVWKLGDNWWVKDGTLTAADQNEHCVLPTRNSQLHP